MRRPVLCVGEPHVAATMRTAQSGRAGSRTSTAARQPQRRVTTCPADTSSAWRVPVLMRLVFHGLRPIPAVDGLPQRAV